ncbi:MAG: primosomal protein N', partial [Elusimicrobiota bacterium]|nr:primosomal protein N' [Elusimicrobiota bacterium]
TAIKSPYKLNSAQVDAVELLEKELARKKPSPALLHGVTYSGKTEVYMRVMAETIKKGKQVLILVPEIAITAQLVDRLKERFGEKAVGVWHSKISRGKKMKYMEFLNKGEMDILIGPRSAVFVPFKNMGTIIIEEEQDPGYKQDNAPPYDARQVAEKRCEMTGALLILSSATPRIETIYRAKRGDYKYAPLPRRVDKSEFPKIELVDMKREYAEREKSGILSGRIIEKLEENLTSGRQVILYINRRGYTSSVICSDCGHTLECPVCNIPYAYHASKGRMECHWCGRSRSVPQRCPRCPGDTYRFQGAGTQKVEDVLYKFYPEAKIGRMDTDTTSKVGSAEKIFKDFKDGKFDILIGTSLLTKGWDFSNVGLVGIINSDLGLMSPDFRAPEKIYLTLMQVAGRCGRSNYRGEVVVQTYNPNHYALKTVLSNKPNNFYNKELKVRRDSGFPPFKDIVAITVSSGSPAKADRYIKVCKKFILERDPGIDILGPAPAAKYKVRGKFRKCLLLKVDSKNSNIKDILKDMTVKNSKLNIAVDVDPQTMP